MEAIGLTSPGAGRWDGRVSTATYLGSEVFYEVTVGQQAILVKVGHPQGAGALTPGEPVGLAFNESSLHLVRREATP